MEGLQVMCTRLPAVAFKGISLIVVKNVGFTIVGEIEARSPTRVAQRSVTNLKKWIDLVMPKSETKRKLLWQTCYVAL
jgi:hypothetical protein